jgi:uncharacterized protein YcfJ
MKSIKIALVATAVMATAAPAFAQYQPTQQYQRDVRSYENDRADYDAARRDYDLRRERYERDRAQYDARYGAGAYARAYGDAPAWDSARWDTNRVNSPSESRAEFDRRAADYDRARAEYDRRYGYGSYARRYGPPPVWEANAYGRDTAYTGAYDPCRGRQSGNTVAGGLIGALAGAALGSNVAARNARTEGAVLGAVVGGAIGAGVGRASANCDNDGYYYSYDQTIPYRESRYDRSRRSGRYDYSYYSRQRCRLAPAPVNESGDDYRYVRVCPDSQGRYRITG